jgi:hypothetical protein
MPTQPTLDPGRFAALVARFDICNPSELEALNAARALRHAAANAKLRVIDALYRADVMVALDTLLKPVREEPPELREAFAKIAELADALRTEREISAALRRERAAQPSSMVSEPSCDALVIAGSVVFFTFALAITLLFIAFFVF